METFLKALEEVLAESDSDRFETTTALSHNLRYSIKVDQWDMDNFSRIFTRVIVDKHHVTPIPETEVKSICWKRAQSEADQLQEKSRSKKSAPNPGVPLLSATVGDHCDGCGKRNHHQRDCLSGKPESKHPDFNEQGPWRDSESYRKIKD